MAAFVVMRVLIALAVCACSAKPTTTETTAKPTAEAPVTTTTPRTDVTQLIAPEVTGIMKTGGADFIIASYVTKLLNSPPPCWTKLRAAITAGYQVELPPSSYFVIEGNLPQRDVEDCVKQAFAQVMPMTIERDGDLVVFRSSAGAVYAKWIGSLIVAGTKDQLARAVAPPDTQPFWAERLAQLPAGRMAMWRSDRLFQNVLGVPAASYVLIVERAEQTPRPFLSARVIARFSTAGDAAIAARRIRQGELTVANPPAEVVAGFKLMKVKQNAQTLDVAFDSDMFYGLDLAKLQQWVAQLAKP